MTYSEEDLTAACEAAVAKALAPFNDAAALDAIALAIEEAKTPFVAQVTELQNAVDTATLRANDAEAKYDALVTMLEAAQAEADRDAEMATRREARKEAVKELSFTDAEVEERLDRWVAMSDEVFAELLDGWKAVSAKKVTVEPVSTSTSIPTTTAMKAGRDDKSVDRFANIREVSTLGLHGVDIRTL